MTDADQIARLLKAGHPLIHIETYEEDHALAQVTKAAHQALASLRVWSVASGIDQGARPGTEHPAAALIELGRSLPGTVAVALDLIDHLQDERTLRYLRDLLETFAQKNCTLVLIDHSGKLPAVIRAHATRFEISYPDEAEIESIVRDTLRTAHRDRPIQVQISRGGLRTVVRNLRGLSRRQTRRIILDVISEDRRFDNEDINHMLALKREALHADGLLEFVESPASLDEIGGMARLKQWLKQRESAVSEAAVEFGLVPPRGVLLLGVQGAGKSMCAKAIATGWQRPLLRLDPTVLYDRYVGESEKRLREALHQAEMMAPIVLWIDEIEKGFASAASQSTDGGLSQRMFGSLLTWMQEHREPVFLVATANNIQALPPELLRKGRFDEIFFVDLPEAQVRRQIFEIHLRRRKRDPQSFDLDALAAASEGYSGAEIEQAIIAAMHAAFAAGSDLNTAMIIEAINTSPPLSVTMAERIADLRDWAVDRCVMAD